MLNKSNLYAIILFLCGVVYIFITPPFQVPDAQTHFYRAYQVSAGEFVSEKRGNRTGGEIPASLLELQSVFSHLKFKPNNKTSSSEIFNAFDIQHTSKNKFVGFENTAAFSPIPYLPAALGITISKSLSSSLLIAYYLSCLCTLIISLIAIRLAMGILPHHGILIFTFSLLPMFMFQLASISSDSLSNSISILFISQIFSVISRENKVHKLFLLKILITGILLALCKQTYSILFILTALVTPRYFNNWARYLNYQIIFCTSILVFLISWQYIFNEIYSPLSWVKGANAKLQLLHIISNPSYFVQIVSADLSHNYQNYILQMGGARLGWLDTHLPHFIIWLNLGILCIIAYTTNALEKLTAWQYLIILMTIIFGILMIELALYLHAQPVGSSRIVGVHGRYFLHLAFVFLLMLSSLPKPFKINTTLQLCLILSSSISYLVSLPAILTRYYL